MICLLLAIQLSKPMVHWQHWYNRTNILPTDRFKLPPKRSHRREVNMKFDVVIIVTSLCISRNVVPRSPFPSYPCAVYGQRKGEAGRFSLPPQESDAIDHQQLATSNSGAEDHNRWSIFTFILPVLRFLPLNKLNDTAWNFIFNFVNSTLYVHMPIAALPIVEQAKWYRLKLHV